MDLPILCPTARMGRCQNKMNIQRLSLLLITVIFLLFFIPNNISAHPGRTASDGCHYCRTNCASWGEVQGARHCHGGYTAPAPTYTAPIVTPLPTPAPTLRPTPIPTSKPTLAPTPSPTPKPTPTLSPSPEPSPEVQGEQTSKPMRSPSSQVSSDSSSGNAGGQVLGWAGVTLFAYLIYKNRKNKKLEKNGGDDK